MTMMMIGRTEDCINGTLVSLSGNVIPQPFINFTTFLKLYEHSLMRQVDPTNAFVPHQHNLTIFNNSRLYINLEGCVNTLRGECRDFLSSHGADGDNQTAQSRYLCYYNKVRYRCFFFFFSLTIISIRNYERSLVLCQYILTLALHFFPSFRISLVYII